MDDDQPAPAPGATRVLQHRQDQQMVEPDVDELGSVDRVDRLRREDARLVGDLAVPRQPARLRRLRPVHLLVRGHDAEDPLRAVAEVEHERGVERDEVAEEGRIEPPGRVREADVDDRTGRVGPPGVDGPVGEPEVGGKVAEEVEGHGH